MTRVQTAALQAVPPARDGPAPGNGAVAPAGGAAAAILAMQRTAGNRATAELVQRLRSLAASDPNDPREREADDAARAALSGVGAARGGPPPRSGARRSGAAPPSALRGALGPGEPLPGQVRARSEARFGRDFGGVRVHTHPGAAAAARALGASAFTVGEDIVFAAGRYLPATSAGDGLLAHELAHVAGGHGAGAPPVAFRQPAPDAPPQEREEKPTERPAQPEGISFYFAVKIDRVLDGPQLLLEFVKHTTG